MKELTAKAADEIIKICESLIVDNINGEENNGQWRGQNIEFIESWAKAIRDANRENKND